MSTLDNTTGLTIKNSSGQTKATIDAFTGNITGNFIKKIGSCSNTFPMVHDHISTYSYDIKSNIRAIANGPIVTIPTNHLLLVEVSTILFGGQISANLGNWTDITFFQN